jgi:hypothetical protein
MFPPGQLPRNDFPRFGLTPYAKRHPEQPESRSLALKILEAEPLVLENALVGLPRSRLKADFHCVTTWSKLGLNWDGVKFADLFSQRVAPFLQVAQEIRGVVLRAQDGYRTTLLLEDLFGRRRSATRR